MEASLNKHVHQRTAADEPHAHCGVLVSDLIMVGPVCFCPHNQKELQNTVIMLLWDAETNRQQHQQTHNAWFMEQEVPLHTSHTDMPKTVIFLFL